MGLKSVNPMAITRGLLTVLQPSLLRSRALCAEPGAQQRGLGASYALHWLERLRLQRQLSRGEVEAPRIWSAVS